MAYQLVEMMATDKKLQSSDFYPEYLIWKRLHYKKRPRTSDDIIAANAPSSKRKKTTGCVACLLLVNMVICPHVNMVLLGRSLYLWLAWVNVCPLLIMFQTYVVLPGFL